MYSLIEKLIHLTIKHFLSLLLIIAILTLGNMFRKELADFLLIKDELANLRISQVEINGYYGSAQKDTLARVAKLESASLHELDLRIAAIDRDIQGKSLQAQQSRSGIPALSMPAIGKSYVDQMKLDVEIKLLRQEREHLDYLRSLITGPTDLEALRRIHINAYAALKGNESDQAQLWHDHPLAIRVPLTWQHAELKRLKAAHESLADDNLMAYQKYELKRKWVAAVKASRRNFEIRRDEINASLQPLNEAIADREGKVLSNWLGKVSGPVVEVIPTALWILLTIILIPIGIKVVFYYVLAPIASRRPPIYLVPEASGAIDGVVPDGERITDQTRISSVSRQIVIDESHELLIHPEYLQSSSTGGTKDTKWLLDYSYPMSSLASGMVALTRIQTDRSESIVISATKDPLCEVGILALPKGSSVVLQPRSLIGVVTHKDVPLRITRHWRLGSLHAWLTLQLRYLAFHGPSELIVKGCRGIRIESSESGRRINQAATIGFSANVAYSTSRCETFASYLLGKQELLNDSFSGAAGFYIYEEMPHYGQRTGITGRGLEGFTDSVLKVFGL